MTKRFAHLPSIPLASANRRVQLDQCLEEVTKGVGPSWDKYRLIGATRAGLAPAKEGVGKNPERYKPVEPGTIFYNPMRILLGSIAFVDEGEEPGITSPDYVVFKGKPEVLHPRWFYYWLRSDEGAAFIKTLTRGAVRERMLFRRLASAEIELPSYDAQLRFAQQMPVIERARAAAEEQLEAAKELPAAYLRTVFDSPEVRKWPKKRLGEIFRIKSGDFLSAKGMAPEGSYPVYGGNGINGYHSKFMFEESKIIIGRVGAQWGCIHITQPRSWITDNALYISEKLNAFDDAFMAFYLLFLDLNKMAHSMAQPLVTGQIIYPIEIGFPAHSDQKKIAKILQEKIKTAEQVCNALDGQLQAIIKIPPALLRQAFNGEL